jgi:hypothetical protein
MSVDAGTASSGPAFSFVPPCSGLSKAAAGTPENRTGLEVLALGTQDARQKNVYNKYIANRSSRHSIV